MSFARRLSDVPHIDRWRKAAVAVVTFAAAAVAIVFYSPITLTVMFGVLMVFAAYTIASGGKPRPPEPASRAEGDRSWAEEALARPLWIETTATSIEWMSLIGATTLGVSSSAQIPYPLDRLALWLLAATPVVIAAAFALTIWERRAARRVLHRLAS